MTVLTPAARVLARTVPGPGGCLLFGGAKNSDGYGKIMVNGKTRPARRVVFEAVCGPLPDDVPVHDTCAVRACVHPDHLEAALPVAGLVNVGRVQDKVFCRNAHLYVPGNLQREVKSGYDSRVCRECAVERKARRQAAR